MSEFKGPPKRVRPDFDVNALANMRVALDVVREVRAIAPKSSNYLATSSPIKSGPGDSAKPLFPASFSRSITPMRKELGPSPASGDEKAWLAWIEKAYKLVVANQAGNCGELSLAAIHLLLRKGAHHIDYVQVTDGKTNNDLLPHEFVVIGRGSTTSPMGMPETWGATAVICDPWDRHAYPAVTHQLYWGGEASENTVKAGFLKGVGTLYYVLCHHFA